MGVGDYGCGIGFLGVASNRLVGASLSEPHTSVTALRTRVSDYPTIHLWTDHLTSYISQTEQHLPFGLMLLRLGNVTIMCVCTCVCVTVYCAQIL